MEQRIFEGYVKWYNQDKGIGFIKSVINDETKDILLHFSELEKNKKFAEINEGDLVMFSLGEFNGKPMAINISLH